MSDEATTGATETIETAPADVAQQAEETPATDPAGAPADTPAPAETTADKQEDPKPDKKGAPSLLDAAEDKPTDPQDEKISDWGKFQPEIPEGVEVSKEALASFGETAVAAGLTARQANALIGWQIKEIQAQQQAMYDLGKEELQKEWGPKFQANTKAVVGLISKIDRMLGDGSFSKSINSSGAGLHPGVIRGLYKLSELISEDSLGKSGAGAAPDQPEDALQGIERQLRNQLARRK